MIRRHLASFALSLAVSLALAFTVGALGPSIATADVTPVRPVIPTPEPEEEDGCSVHHPGRGANALPSVLLVLGLGFAVGRRARGSARSRP